MEQQGFLQKAIDTLNAGGPVMWVLFAVSIVAVAVIFTKIYQYRAMQLGNLRFSDKALAALRSGDDEAARKTLAATPSPIARVLETAMNTAANPNLTTEDRNAIISQTGQRELRKVGYLLRTLELIANISPLIGLLGTVTGMIQAFSQLELAGSQVDPSLLAGGIWEAMLTTAAGLTIAIPSYAAFTLLDGKMERIRQEMGGAATQVIEIFHERRHGRTTRVPEPALAGGERAAANA